MASPSTSLAKENIKIVLLEGIHPSAEEVFRKDGYSNIVTATKSLPEDELMIAWIYIGHRIFQFYSCIGMESYIREYQKMLLFFESYT